MIADLITDLFAGPGGWSEALRNMGHSEVGIEWDKAACATRTAAGHLTVAGSVLHQDLMDFEHTTGLIASPPRQTFSKAGKGAGRKALDDVLIGVKALAAGMAVPTFDDERTALVLEPLRWALELEPAWIALEQVPTVLPVWEAYADVLREDGYSVATGNLTAEMFGVPQTRKRAILVAHRTREAVLPTPTHSRYYSRDPKRLDPGVAPWISMAEALGWPDGLVGFPRRADEGRPSIQLGDALYRERDLRTTDLPAQVVTEKARSWKFMATNDRPNVCKRSLDQPAPTLSFGHERPRWAYERPSTTIVGSFKPEVVAAPGYRTTVSRQNAPDSVTVTVQEAALLQSFRPDYPWQGSRTKQFQQVGNAIPPLLAEAILRQLL